MAAPSLSCLLREACALRRSRRLIVKSRRLKARADAAQAEARRILADLEVRHAALTPTIAGRTYP